MPESSLLEQLAGQGTNPDSNDPWAAVKATRPAQQTVRRTGEDGDRKLADLLRRVNRLTTQQEVPQDSAALATEVAADEDAAGLAPSQFTPREPATFEEAGLTESAIEELVLKFLLARGDASGRMTADQIKVPFVLVEELLRQLKSDQMIVYKGSASLNDYVCRLTDLGRERARRYAEQCTYFGAAPVSLLDYVASVEAQSLAGRHPSPDDLKRAFADLLVNPKLLAKLGPAVNSGRGMFLYGAPGNGKTSISERVTKAFGDVIWIPRALGIDGEIMRLFDPMNHEEVPLERSDGLLDQSHIDKRWVRIRRPTIIVAGELTMDNLEVTLNKSTGISEAPLQLKSNCGTLVIDDFGRQRISIDELLNRWIVPLEKRFDFLNLANGKKIQVPFDQLIVFSTNLEPRDLVDEAFLRRIPYKIEVEDPPEEDFRALFRLMCPKLGFEYRKDAIDYLIDKHYKSIGRPFRSCHPRDLLLQVRSHCLYEKKKQELLPAYLDFAVENYFAVM